MFHPMDAERLRQLCAANDRRLSAFIAAADDAARTAAIEAVLQEARPMVRRVADHMRTEAIRAEDIDDIESTVNFRLFRRLQLARIYEEEAIRSLDEFVATLTYNAIYDLLRHRFPERTRLKARLRYLFTHDRRLALWSDGAAMVCGRAEWRGRPAGGPHGITREAAPAVMTRRAAPGDAVLAVFARAGGPLPFEDLVDLAAELWRISDAARPLPKEARAADDAPLDRIEARQYLVRLWSEVRELRGPQRAALLLNLRDDDGENALVHLVSANIAGMDEVAEVLGLSLQRLAAIWDSLPLGDAAIAEMLSLTRQQVINLRKSARERLARRMK